MEYPFEHCKVLIVDDEPQIRKLLKISLESIHVKIIEATSGSEGISFAAMYKPDIIILDMGLGDMSGLDVLQKTREWSSTPIIILSVENTSEIISECLDQGADDYVTKPFDVNIFLSRVKVCLRRNLKSEIESPVLIIKNLQIDFNKRIVLKNGVEVKLTSTEYDLLKFLVKNIGKVVTQRQILKEVWGPNAPLDSQYPRVYIRHLRTKLENDPNNPELILTESGIGYRFQN